MQLKGIYYQYNITDNKSTAGSFLIKTADTKIIKCIDLAPQLKKNIPVILTGELDPNFSNTFHCQEIEINDLDRKLMVEFLKGRAFKGINDEKARKIYDTLLFMVSKDHLEHLYDIPFQDIIDAITSIGIDEEPAQTVGIELTGLKNRIDLFKWFASYDGAYSDAEKAFLKYGESARKVLEKDPYKGILCGIPFRTCDKIAYKNNINKYAPSRIDAILSAISDSIEKAGCCCEKKEKIIETATRIQYSSAYRPLSKKFLLLSIASSDKFIITKSKQYGLLIYPKYLYSVEQGIANEIHRLTKKPILTDYEGYFGDNLDCDQIKATNFLKSSGVYILTGGPGAGKTTTIKTIVSEYKEINKYDSVFLCAPTGRAAVRITESINNPEYQGQTIHRLIGLKLLDSGYEPSYNKDEQLPKGLYIADEMSMVDEKIFLQFLQAIPDGSTVILSGDPAQLQSVAAGSVLKDLIMSHNIPCVFLNQIHRQAEGSVIINNYYHLRDNHGYLEEGSDFHIEKFDDQEAMRNRVLELFKILNKDTEPFNTQIITFARKGVLGKENLDLSVILSKRPSGNNDVFAINDKVMTTRNNYKTEYYNGDIGIINAHDLKGFYIKFQDGRELLLENEDVYDVEHSWATTVHKAQGSEFDNIIIVIDDEYKNMLYRSILLTAITRAKKNVYIICKESALNTAITTSKENERVTGLSELI